MSYTVGERYWVPDEEHAWLAGTLKEFKNATVDFQTEKGQRKFRVSDIKEKLEPCGSHIDDNMENLVDLDELSEGAILHHLRKRFAKKIIYTHVGSILVAVNPFENLPIYSEKDIQKAYTSTQIYPHVFSTASLAYSQLKMNRKNQSVLISGESGAGKTETTKKVLTFLASVASPPHTHGTQQVGIETKILQSNPLLEALGNAKTLRNNNSSRFGKWMKVGFNDSFTIQGCEIINYLLEKSRVVSQSTSERNYHIFYQLIAGATKEMKAKYSLRALQDYNYLNQSGCMIIDGVNDADEFKDVLEAMKTLEFTPDIMDNIFKIISSILLLGNLQYALRTKDKDDACITEQSENEYLSTIMTLLDVDPILFKFALTEKRVQMGRGSVVTLKLNIIQSIDCRDTIAKTLYSHLFDWTIQQVNETLKPTTGNGMNTKVIPYSIGILDIFGFEVFDINSFEQLCINFANEKLQQHFNDVIFQEEMKMYVEEGISLQQIEFEDNQPCVSLIENKPYGILALLEEECSLGNATDITFINKLDKTFGSNSKTCNKYFVKNKVKPDCFSISHFAGLVEYNVNNFLEKNKDNLSITIKEVMLQSKNSFVHNLFVVGSGGSDGGDHTAEKSSGGKGGGGRKGRGSTSAMSSKSTLGTQFRNQLIGLVSTLRETEPHFIRCVKPNHLKVSQLLDGHLALRQMKYAGLFEAIRIRQSGYAYRMTHQVFIQQYHILVPMLQKRIHKKELSYYQGCQLLQEFIVSNGILSKERMHLGTATRIFFKSTSDRIPLEQAKQTKILVYVIKIQRQVKSFLNYLYYSKEMILLKKEKLKIEEMRNVRGNAIQKIQSLWRGFAIRRMLSSMNDFFALRKALKLKKIPLIKDILYRIDKEFNILSQQSQSQGMVDNSDDATLITPKKSLASIWEVTTTKRQKKVISRANAMKTAVFQLFAHEIKVGKVMLKLLEIQDTFLQDLQQALDKHDIAKLNQLLMKSERLELTSHPLVQQAKELVYTLFEKRNVMKEILSFLTQFQDPATTTATTAEGSVRGQPSAASMAASAYQNTFMDMNEEDVQRLLSKAKAANIPQEFLDKVNLVYSNISPRLKTRNKLRFAIETINRYDIEQYVLEIIQIRLHYHLFGEIELRAARMILQWLQWDKVLFPSSSQSGEEEEEEQSNEEEDDDEGSDEEVVDDGNEAKPEHDNECINSKKNKSTLLWGQPILKQSSQAKLSPEYRDLCQTICEANFPTIRQMHEKRLQAAVEYNIYQYYEIIRCYKFMRTVCVWRYPNIATTTAADHPNNNNGIETSSALHENNNPIIPISGGHNNENSNDFYSFRLSDAMNNPYIIKSLHPDFDIYLQHSYSANMDAALSNLELSSSMHNTLQQLDMMHEIDKDIILPNGSRYFKTVTKHARYYDKYGDGRAVLGGGNHDNNVDYEGMNLAGMGMTGLTNHTTNTTVGMNSRLLQSTSSNSGKKVSYTLKPNMNTSMTPISSPKKGNNMNSSSSSGMVTPGKTPIATTKTTMRSPMIPPSPSPRSPQPHSPMSTTSSNNNSNKGDTSMTATATATATRRKSFLPPNMPVKIIENLPPSSLEKQLHDSRISKQKELHCKAKDRNHEVRYTSHSGWK